MLPSRNQLYVRVHVMLVSLSNYEYRLLAGISGMYPLLLIGLDLLTPNSPTPAPGK